MAILLGFFLVPLVPSMLDFACEITHPIRNKYKLPIINLYKAEAIAVGLLFAGGHIFGVAFGSFLGIFAKG
jgi:hypothetical protein